MAKSKLKKTLYVGLGGTGVQVLLNVKKCFIDIYGEIPPMIGFLAIDTDTSALNKEVTSNRGNSIKLDSNELLVCTVQQALNVYRNNPKNYDWVPQKNIDKLSSISGSGAGQVRSNGRFIAFYNFRKIRTNIQSAITKINQLLPQDSPYEVELNMDGVERPIIINVFGSVAGGTGSGMLIDTLCLVKDAVDTLARKVNIYPWILLPEVFRAMNNGPAMNNVLYNTYGALQSLDYLKHLNPGNQAAVNLGYATLNEAPFDYAYIINNYNQAGVSFDKIKDLAEIIAKSAFLPSNKMGDELSSPFDNIVVQQNATTYDIRDKKAWAASAGSAELVYDNQAVGRCYAHRIISQLCNNLINTTSTGAEAANKFVDNQDVMIRENNGRNDVIDALLNPNPEYIYEISKDTTVEDLNSYIAYNTESTNIEGAIREAFNHKLTNTKVQFKNYVDSLIDSSVNGGVENVLKFISALKTIIAKCLEEMEDERQQFNRINSLPVQLEEKLTNCRRTGLASLFGSRMDEENVSILQQELSMIIINRKEELRRDWAIRFYNSFIEYIDENLHLVENLKGNLQRLSNNHRDDLLSEQQNADSTSNFQINLHKDDVNNVTSYIIDEALTIEFEKHFKEKGGLHQWLSLSLGQIDLQLWNFAKNTSKILDVVNHTIDDVLRELKRTNPQKVKGYLERLKVLASPLWGYNPQGYNESEVQLDRFVIVGVNNRDTDLLCVDSDFNTYFDEGTNKTNFASTNQHDRIYVMVVEDLLPIYAVNNFTTYQKDAENKELRNVNMANYIDEKLHNRMMSENFSVLPKIEKDNMLEMWVYGFVFGLIKFDEEKETYWLRSKRKGSAIRQFRFDLNKQRDVAFDLFKSEGFAKELEDTFNEKIRREGRDAFENIISQIKEKFTYMDEYAQLSRLEKENLEEPRFHAVRRLLEQEITLMSN